MRPLLLGALPLLFLSTLSWANDQSSSAVAQTRGFLDSDALRATQHINQPNAGDRLIPPGSTRAQDLHLSRGYFAESHHPCDPQGEYSLYNAMLNFSGDGLSNSVTSRTITDVQPTKSGFKLSLYVTQSDGIGGGGAPERRSWDVSISDPQHFTVRGQDHGDDWSGDYRFCGVSPFGSTDAAVPNSAPLPTETKAPLLALSGLDIERGTLNGEFGVSYLHNGSEMILFEKAGVIVYDKPKPSLAGVVKRGDVLFAGLISRTSASGVAYMFKSGCAPAPYTVTGRWLRGVLVLAGASPVHAHGSCAVIGTSTRSANARLSVTPAILGDL